MVTVVSDKPQQSRETWREICVAVRIESMGAYNTFSSDSRKEGRKEGPQPAAEFRREVRLKQTMTRSRGKCQTLTEKRSRQSAKGTLLYHEHSCNEGFWRGYTFMGRSKR